MKGTKVLRNPRRRALDIRMRYMCTHARYCYWWAGPLRFIQLVVAYHLAESQSLASYTTNSQRSPCIATSGASKVRRAGRGKPVLICILAPSLCFTP